MINDAQFGDKPAMVDDARYASDEPLPTGAPFSEKDLVVETGAPAATEESEVQSAEVAEAPQEPAEDAPDPDEVDHEAQGRAAVEMGQPRSANPYDRRKAEGKAWYRGWDSAEGGSKE